MSAPSLKFQKLLAKLRELFELDKADLDFGLYRVLRARRDEIDRFLREDLLPQVREELGVVTEEKIKPMESKVQDEIANVMKYGGKSREEAEASPTVLEAKALLEQARNPAALEDEVYSLLTTFFGRYYEAGDFISQRRYSGPGKERYMLPYNGEEVKLVWANMDQYYIKSAENFRDYTFRVPALQPDEAVPEPDTRPRISFRLVEADTEKDNVKATAGKRLFALADPSQFAIERATEDALITLRIPFTYAVRDKDDKQDDLLASAEEAILTHPNVPADVKKHLSAKAPTPTRADRTLLAKHLEAYAAKNSFDYFIHKDLGGFLGRELDYFLKSEVLRMDDLLTDDDHQRALTLKKARAFKKVAEKVITFLHRQEQFQKKLWLKKKFVVSCDYAITLDLIPDEFYPEIAANEAQRGEWVDLYGINLIEKDTTTPGYSEPLTEEFLKAHQSLVVDSRLFPKEFAGRLAARIENQERQTHGILINGDNFHGLRMLEARWKSSVECIYIDPPYNTGNDGFTYKDNFQRSSWCSLIYNRISLAESVLSTSGSLAISLDYVESAHLTKSIEQSTRLNKLGEFVWKTRNTDNRVISNFSVDHEYIHLFVRPGSSISGRKIDRSNFKNPDGDIRGDYTTDPLTGKANRDARPNLHYTIVNEDTGDVYEPDPDFGWITNKEGFEALLTDNRIFWPENPRTGKPRKKRFRSEASERAPVSSLAISIKQGEGNADLANVIGYKALSFPKPVSVISAVCDYCGNVSSTILDFFAGSGTTAHAVINLNREDAGDRKYILIEMGDHFETVLVRRIKKVVYSPDWSEGEPVTRDKGISHCMKIVKLESYEDCLNNLVLARNPDQEDLLKRNKDLREDYLLGYFLDVETRGSVLKLDHFRDPWNYRMKIATGSVGETRETAIDLVETFSWLLGLTVRHQSAIQYRRPDKGFAEDEHGRLQLIGGLTRGADPAKDADARGFQTVEGTLRSGENVLVIWRSLTPAKDGEDAVRLLEEDNVMLESFLSRTGLNPREKQWDLIYVNGDHTLDNLAEQLADESEAPRFKVRTIEPEFHRLMFEGTED